MPYNRYYGTGVPINSRSQQLGLFPEMKYFHIKLFKNCVVIRFIDEFNGTYYTKEVEFPPKLFNEVRSYIHFLLKDIPTRKFRIELFE